MREWCSCGAAIRGRRRDVLEWRETHRCPDRPEQPGGEHASAGAFIEHAGDRYFDGEAPIVTARRVGFQPND